MIWNNKLSPFKDKVLAIDFDGTLVEDKFPEIGSPKEDIISWVKECKNNGCKLILWTSRNNGVLVNNKGALDLASDYCRNVLGIEFDAINENIKEVQEKWGGDTRKVFADYYLDDKAIVVK